MLADAAPAEVAFWQEHHGRPPTLHDVTVTAAEASAITSSSAARSTGATPRSPVASLWPRAMLRTYVWTLKIFASWLADDRQA
jgi:hypothetical protein